MRLFGANIGTLTRVFSFDQDPLLYSLVLITKVVIQWQISVEKKYIYVYPGT